MNMSHSNLYRKMKSLFGMPPNNYVKNFRLNKAAELIANGVRIAEAAERLGFASSSHLQNVLKRNSECCQKIIDNKSFHDGKNKGRVNEV